MVQVGVCDDYEVHSVKDYPEQLDKTKLYCISTNAEADLNIDCRAKEFVMREGLFATLILDFKKFNFRICLDNMVVSKMIIKKEKMKCMIVPFIMAHGRHLLRTSIKILSPEEITEFEKTLDVKTHE